MVTPELVEATVWERSQRAAEIERQQRAQDLLAGTSARRRSPRRAPSHWVKRRLRLPAFVVRAFRMSSAS